MVLHGTVIPKIEGFQPIPNAVMIPFMEAQSAALAFGFGLNYEFGKRKIRSMSNEEFNSLTSEQIANMSNEHTHIILSQFQAQIPRVMPMQIEIFKQYVLIEKEKVIQNVALAKWIAQNFPQLLAEGTASDSSSTIRDTTKTGDRLAIGTETSQGVIVGYIDGVPQYKSITQDTSSRRNTSSSHISSHNDILSKYDEIKKVEGWIHFNSATQSRASKNADKIKSWIAGIKRMLQMVSALQKNHEKNHGHQVTPFSARI